MSSTAPAESTYRIPDGQADDLAKLKAMTAEFRAGTLSEPHFKAFRVPLGVYEQRTEGTFMLRVRFPGGAVQPGHMRCVAAVSKQYGNGVLHVTTRQEIQVHNVPLDDVHPALEALAAGNLSTKGGGGNTVRNITTCPGAGVCGGQAFDVSPHGVALTEFLLPDPLSYQLPRKYKIAFSGCSGDCAGGIVNDLGCIAKVKDGQKGFTVYACGGLGAKSGIGHLLEEFVPEDEIHHVAQAIKQVFDQHGDRKNRNKARLRFLVARIGMDAFRALYETELAAVRESNPPALDLSELPTNHGESPAEAAAPAEGFDLWREKAVGKQKQQGFFRARIPLELGDITADTMTKLADVVEAHGEGLLHATQEQNLVMRWVPEKGLPALHRALDGIGLALTPPPVLSNMTACTGASTCKLGMCLSRGLTGAIEETLSASTIDLEGLGNLKIQVSGCPNSCSRHPIAQIGLHGAARRVSGHLAPFYILQLGGRLGEGKTRLAEGKNAIPARNVPAVVAEFLQAFSESPEHPDYDAFLKARGVDLAADLTAKHKQIPSFEEDPAHYTDWTADEPFSLAGRGPGECGAGVFDLIEVDLASAKEALQSGRLFAATVLAARALLVTQGHEAKDDTEVLRLFTESFIDAGLVGESLRSTTDAALACAASATPEEDFSLGASEVEAFVGTVQELYANMDSSLRFKPVVSEDSTGAKDDGDNGQSSAAIKTDREENFVGVSCPLNYVKTKMVLGKMDLGQVLAILVDKDGADNVPDSVTKDGHEVLSSTKEGDAWRVLIRKGGD